MHKFIYRLVQRVALSRHASSVVHRPSSIGYRASSIGIAYTPWLAMCMHKMYNKIVISVEHLLSAQIGRDKFEGVATGCRLWLWLWLWDLSLGRSGRHNYPSTPSLAMAWHRLAWLGLTRLACQTVHQSASAAAAAMQHALTINGDTGCPLKETGPAAAQRENAC